jgi:hypothetical protein
VRRWCGRWQITIVGGRWWRRAGIRRSRSNWRRRELRFTSRWNCCQRNALARALRLPAEDRSHLYTVAQAVDLNPPASSVRGDQDGMRRMLDVFGSTPAVLCGPFSDILDTNDAGPLPL